MAYRVKINADLSKDLRRLLTGQIGRAIAHLTGVADEGGSAVHETRKALKRCRSILRLARPGIGSRRFTAEDHAFRAIARILSSERDREVMAQTLARLGAEDRPAAEKDVLAAAADALQNGGMNGHSHEDVAANARLAIAMLQETERSIRQLEIRPARIATLAEGFAATYADARKAMKAAYRSGEDEAFHGFRKCVQHHWRQLQLLAPAWPELMQVRVAAARELSQIIGDDHDLSVLAAHLADDRTGLFSPAVQEAVGAIARAEQTRLRADAKPLAGRLFAQKPRDMERLIVQLWPASVRLARHRRLLPESAVADAVVLAPSAPTPSGKEAKARSSGRAAPSN
jgi:CHAD domain-containing protein